MQTFRFHGVELNEQWRNGNDLWNAKKIQFFSFLPTKIAMDICVSLISHCWTLPREHESWLSWNCRTWNERKQNEWGSRDFNNNASQRLCILGILSVLVLCPESYLLINIDVKQNECYEGNDPVYYEVHINEVNLEQMRNECFMRKLANPTFDFNEP